METNQNNSNFSKEARFEPNTENPGPEQNNSVTLQEELQSLQYELRQQALTNSRNQNDNSGLGQTDIGGPYNLDVSSLVVFEQGNDTEEGESVNKIKTRLRCCFANEIKSAKELKIYLKGENPIFWPIVSYNTNPLLNINKLDLRSKKPLRNPAVNQPAQGVSLQGLDLGGFQTGYCEDLDRWLLTHMPIFEDTNVHRGVCRVYAIYISETLNKFMIQASSGFVVKIKETRFVVSTMSITQCNPVQSQFILESPILVASFGNLDLVKPFWNILGEMVKLGQISKKKVKQQLLDDFHRCLVSIKPNNIGIGARKEWLTSNSRCSEILDSEFYYQMLPSLDFCLFNIEALWLRERNIAPLKIMKPDWRYLTCGSIGYSCPRVLEFNEWRQKYGQSRGVCKDESNMLNQHKTLSIGKVKSYGSVTCVQMSAGTGAQGSPVFNELGKCWGLLVGSYPDIPPKLQEEIVLPDVLNMPGNTTLKDTEPEIKIVKKKKKSNKTEKERKKKDKKKRKRKEKEREEKERKKKREVEAAANAAASAAMNQPELGNAPLMSKSVNDQGKKRSSSKEEQSTKEIDVDGDLKPLEFERENSENTDSQNSQEAKPIAGIDDNNILGDHYFEVRSEHCLMPLLPQVNSYNRNMVLSMGHSGVKFIIEKVSQALEQEYQVQTNVRDKIMDRSLINDPNKDHHQLQNNPGKLDVSDSGRPQVTIDRDIIEQARKVGRTGVLTNMVLFDMNKKEAMDMNKKTLLEYRSIDEAKSTASSITPEKRPPPTDIDSLLEAVNQPLPEIPGDNDEQQQNPESEYDKDNNSKYTKCKIGGKTMELTTKSVQKEDLDQLINKPDITKEGNDPKEPKATLNFPGYVYGCK